MKWIAAVSWLAVAFFALPLLVVIGAAFTDANYISFPPPRWGTRWFLASLRQEIYFESLLLSVRLAAATSIVSTILALAVAWGIGRLPQRTAQNVLAFFSLPLLIPVMLIGLALLQLCATLGMPRNFATLLLGHLVLATPFAVRILYSALAGFDRTLEKAALVLGASGWRTFLRVTLPCIRPGVVASAALTFLLSFDDVVVSVFLAAPGARTLPAVIFNHLDQSLSPDLVAISALIIVVSVALILVIQRSVGLSRVFDLHAARPGGAGGAPTAAAPGP